MPQLAAALSQQPAPAALLRRSLLLLRGDCALPEAVLKLARHRLEVAHAAGARRPPAERLRSPVICARERGQEGGR